MYIGPRGPDQNINVLSLSLSCCIVESREMMGRISLNIFSFLFFLGFTPSGQKIGIRIPVSGSKSFVDKIRASLCPTPRANMSDGSDGEGEIMLFAPTKAKPGTVNEEAKLKSRKNCQFLL
jgi:hypothetical protein